MTRLPRLDLSGIPQHIVQRGNNRLPCFLDYDDRRCYLTLLGEALLRYGVGPHAYVLMTNHVHLLLTPTAAGATSPLMQTLGRNYAGYFNARHRRSGRLWEGRFKSCLVESETYLLGCYRYIELDRVRAWMVERPSDYPLSSHQSNIGAVSSPWLTSHAEFLKLGTDAASRGVAYSALVAEGLDHELLHDISVYLQQQRALGTDRFRATVEAPTQRFTAGRPAHRPR